MKYFFMLLLLSFNVYGETKTVTWTPPTEREDNTPLPASEIAYYNVYISDGALGTYPNVVRVNGTTHAVTLLNVVRHLGVKTVDTGGRESSKFSNIIHLPAAVTAPPKSARVSSVIK